MSVTDSPDRHRSGGRRRREGRRGWRRGLRRWSWIGVTLVCLLLAGVIALRLASHLQPEQAGLERDAATPTGNSPIRHRLAFASAQLDRILLHCRLAWAQQEERVLQPQALAWQASQLDLYVAEDGAWRHYWCRDSGAGRGALRSLPAAVAGERPLPLELLLFDLSEALADDRLRSIELLADGRGSGLARLRWNDGLESGVQRALPPAEFDSLLRAEEAGRLAAE